MAMETEKSTAKEVYASETAIQEEQTIDNLTHCMNESSRGTGMPIHHHYEVGDRIGKHSHGSGGDILHCKRLSDGTKFAVKKIEKRRSWEGKSQILALQRLEHRNIIDVVDWFEDIDDIYIIMELATGGDLCDKIIKVGRMPEKDTVIAFSQILLAVNYMHGKNVIHCDIKPENILCMSPDEDTVKVADFGFAQLADQGCQILKHQGTLTYCAPEVLEGKTYDSKADMWSLGVLLYSMLAGFAPFGQRLPRTQFLQKIRQCQLNFRHDVFSGVSADAQDLIRRLVVVSPQDRLSAADALRHPWVAGRVIHGGDGLDALTAHIKGM
jgi:calcium/calmodulin-dependent protein kinase I